MMKTLTLVLILSVGLAFAGVLYTNAPSDLGSVVPSGGYTYLPPSSNDLLWENPYDFGLLANGLNSSGPYRCDDDFVLDEDATIEGFTFWGVYTIGHPQPFAVDVTTDASGAPGSTVWSDTVTDVTDTDTGDDNWGYDLWRTDIVLDSSFDLAADTYWVEFYWTVSTFYWLCENGGNMHQNGSNTGYDAFFAVNGFAGEPDETPPFVEGMDPDDGEVDVPVDSTIVFHCVDEQSPVDLDTIDFAAEDTSLTGGRALGTGSPNRVIAGALDLDDADPLDVVCTFTPTDEFYEDDTITCTVAAGLADTKDNEMEEDFVWSFDIYGETVEETTWGAIKAGI